MGRRGPAGDTSQRKSLVVPRRVSRYGETRGSWALPGPAVPLLLSRRRVRSSCRLFPLPPSVWLLQENVNGLRTDFVATASAAVEPKSQQFSLYLSRNGFGSSIPNVPWVIDTKPMPFMQPSPRCATYPCIPFFSRETIGIHKHKNLANHFGSF